MHPESIRVTNLRPALLPSHTRNLRIHQGKKLVSVLCLLHGQAASANNSASQLLLQSKPTQSHLLQQGISRVETGELLFEGLDDAALFGKWRNRNTNSLKFSARNMHHSGTLSARLNLLQLVLQEVAKESPIDVRIHFEDVLIQRSCRPRPLVHAQRGSPGK